VRWYTIFWVYDLYIQRHYMNGDDDGGRPLYTAAESFHITEAFNLTTVYICSITIFQCEAHQNVKLPNRKSSRDITVIEPNGHCVR